MIAAISKTEDLFFNKTGLDKNRVIGLVQETLHGLTGGELFLEYKDSEMLSFDDGRLKSASSNTRRGFGLRAVKEDLFAYAHNTDFSEKALIQAAATVSAIRAGDQGKTESFAVSAQNREPLYITDNPLHSVDFKTRVKLLEDINAYARSQDERVRQVSISLSGSWQAIHILQADGKMGADIRPLVVLHIAVMMEENGRCESGSYGTGGRVLYEELLEPNRWKGALEEAIRQAAVNLQSVPAPAGEMVVVLGNGWPGILLHEAVGHGLEGDFNRKKSSAFSSLMGQQVAAKEITVVDDGTLENRRGSINIDDEGTPSAYNVLIEDGILTSYMQDKMNAALMGVPPTGNGRRESFAHPPMPRMTNTYMLGGAYPKEEILSSVKKGLYAVSFGGGQVDITSGQYVFSATEAYLIEDGKITAPVKGATLIGNGPEDLKKVSMVGNDLKLDPGIGTCGKDGQSVPVGVGQPSLRLDGITVGGTAVSN